ncbi:MAG: MFS transporter [Sphingomonadales bacterium]
MDVGSTGEFAIEAEPRTFMRSLGLGVLATGSLLTGTMLTVVIPILPNIAKELSHNGSIGLPTQILIAMPMLGLVIGGVLSTVIFTHFRARTVFLVGLLLFAVVGGLGYVANMPMLMALRLLIGIISALIGAASTALVGERVAPDQRPRILGWSMAAATVASIASMLISGRVADAFGWRASFLVFPVIALLLFAIAMLCTRPSSVRVGQPLGRRPTNWQAIFVLWPIFLLVIAINLTAFTTNSQASFVLADGGITTSTGRAQVMSVNLIMIVVAALMFPLVRGWVGMRFMPAIILLVMGCGLVMLGMTSGMVHAAIALAILGIGNGWLFPYQSSLLLQRAPGEVRGQAAGLMVSSQFLADAVNPILLGPLVLTIGLRSTIALVGVVTLVGFMAALIVGARTTEAASDGAKLSPR